MELVSKATVAEVSFPSEPTEEEGKELKDIVASVGVDARAQGSEDGVLHPGVLQKKRL